MMHVQIIDAEIPEGYTYKRTDRFTKAEFIAEFRKDDRKAAKKWAEEHPKEVYTIDDVHRFRNETSPAFRYLCGDAGRPVYSTYHGASTPFIGRTTKRYGSGE